MLMIPTMELLPPKLVRLVVNGLLMHCNVVRSYVSIVKIQVKKKIF